MVGLLNSLPPVSGKDTDWDSLGLMLGGAFDQTLYIVYVAMLIGGVTGLAIGVLFYTTRDGGILRNKFVYQVLNVLTDFVRPILFIILVTVIGPLTGNVVGTTISTKVAVLVMSVAATFAIACLMEQNLMSTDPGAVEAARMADTNPWRVTRTVVVPEALGPLVPGCTFAFITVVSMSAVAGYIGGGGLGNFVITYGYQAFDWNVTLVTALIIIFTVQLAQIFGN